MILNCSVLGTGVTVSVPLSEKIPIKNEEISLKFLTVDFLKKYIWEREKNILEDLTNDSSGLSLWNVNVDEVKDVTTENDIEQKLGGKKMISHLLFSFYFKDEPPVGKIHIIVQPLPATTGKCLPISNKKFALSHLIFFFILSEKGKRPLEDSDEGQNSKRAKQAGM
jgi:hypothetical protein